MDAAAAVGVTMARLVVGDGLVANPVVVGLSVVLDVPLAVVATLDRVPVVVPLVLEAADSACRRPGWT